MNIMNLSERHRDKRITNFALITLVSVYLLLAPNGGGISVASTSLAADKSRFNGNKFNYDQIASVGPEGPKKAPVVAQRDPMPLEGNKPQVGEVKGELR